MLGLRFCARAFSSCGKRGPLFIAVCGPLTIAAFLVSEHRLQMRRLSSCGSRAQLLHGMWDLPRPGLEPVPPALAGGFSTAAPPGKPLNSSLTTLSFFAFNSATLTPCCLLLCVLWTFPLCLFALGFYIDLVFISQVFLFFFSIYSLNFMTFIFSLPFLQSHF